MKPHIRDGAFLGHSFETANAYFFFGSRHLDRNALASLFPEFQFCFLKQVHGNQVVYGDPGEVFEADGHFTAQPNHALVIVTADCVPLMLSNSSQVCALHAGWKGVAFDIVAASKLFFSEPPDVAVFGPHIQCGSFEIGLDVRDQLLRPVVGETDREQFVRPHADPQKCYFNLAALLKFQLRHRFPRIKIFDGGEDTFSNPAYYSFRRDKGAPGRQYSFVVLKP